MSRSCVRRWAPCDPLNQGRAYRLAAAPGEVYAAGVQALAARGRRALAADWGARARQRLCTALGLWLGQLLADFTYEAFAQAGKIGRLQEARLAALETASRPIWRAGPRRVVAELEPPSRRPLPERLAGS